MLEPCALNTEFQRFIPRFNKISLLCGYHYKRWDRGAKAEEIRGETEGDSKNDSNMIYISTSFKNRMFD
jgi:hypothetical protein